MQLEKSENESHWKLLHIFAFGTYSDYKGKIDSDAKKKRENIPVTTPLYQVKDWEPKAAMASFSTLLLKKLLPLQSNELHVYFTPVNGLSMEVPVSSIDCTFGVIHWTCG